MHHGSCNTRLWFEMEHEAGDGVSRHGLWNIIEI